MQTVKVKDLMVPLAEYATVSQDATLYEAVTALEEAQSKFSQRKYMHRAILVYDEKKKIVGKLSQLDVLRGLEPGYKDIGDFKNITRSGYSANFIRSIMKSNALWQKPLDNICAKAGQIKVKEIMYTPAEGEYVQEEATLDQAVHQLVFGHHQSLVVTQGDEVVGILRLTDVFAELCRIIKACQL